MSDQFVPITAGRKPSPAASSDNFRLSVVPGSVPCTGFQPAHASASATGQPSTALRPHPGGDPKITLHRDGDRVQRIQIDCSCGQVISLDCDY